MMLVCVMIIPIAHLVMRLVQAKTVNVLCVGVLLVSRYAGANFQLYVTTFITVIEYDSLARVLVTLT